MTILLCGGVVFSLPSPSFCRLHFFTELFYCATSLLCNGMDVFGCLAMSLYGSVVLFDNYK